MRFNVTLRTPGGTEDSRIVEAPNRFAVYGIIESEGGTVLAMTEAKKPSNVGFFSLAVGGTSIGPGDKITFTKNLAAMLAAGLTLSRALSVIERQSSNKALRIVVIDLAERIKTGGSLHDAFAAHPKVFSPLYTAMTRAGEESGTVAESLRVIARQMESSYLLEKKVKGAMIYPAIIVMTIIVIGILMLIYVVPTLSATFESLGAELPLATRVIVALSNFMKDNVILVFALLIGAFSGLALFFRSKAGSALMLGTALRLPVIGELVRETMSARAARSLSSLLTSGVQMLTALTIASEVVGKNVFGRVLVEAEANVRKGETLSLTFNKYPKLYPLFMADMIAVGEETGKVADMLGQVAVYYEVDVEEKTKDLSTIIEPVLMLFIGLMVGIFAISMIAPIYSLSSKI